MALGLSPWAPSDGPDSLEDLTPEYLTRALASSVPEARVDGFAPAETTSGTTNRHRLKLEWNAAGAGAGLPETVFLKSTPLVGRNRALCSVLRMPPNELDFYR
ncbi:MAG: phosphotransferase, partial [Actinomycetota bacterium]